MNMDQRKTQGIGGHKDHRGEQDKERRVLECFKSTPVSN